MTTVRTAEGMNDEVLRAAWGWNGTIESDCGALTNIHHTFNYTAAGAPNAAAAMKGGCDVECDSVYKDFLATAVNDKVNHTSLIHTHARTHARARIAANSCSTSIQEFPAWSCKCVVHSAVSEWFLFPPIFCTGRRSIASVCTSLALSNPSADTCSTFYAYDVVQCSC